MARRFKVSINKGKLRVKEIKPLIPKSKTKRLTGAALKALKKKAAEERRKIRKKKLKKVKRQARGTFRTSAVFDVFS